MPSAPGPKAGLAPTMIILLAPRAGNDFPADRAGGAVNHQFFADPGPTIDRLLPEPHRIVGLEIFLADRA